MRCYENKALALAYRSLLKRLQQQVPGALADADRAVSDTPDCFEAHAARLCALMTDKRIVDAMAEYAYAWRLTPRDSEGHFLKLLVFIFFIEVILGSEEDDQGVNLRFELTPLTRGAIRLLDGYPQLAVQEFLGAGDNSLADIGRGLAFYRIGGDQQSACSKAFENALESMPAGSPPGVALSVKRLLRDLPSAV